jgi:hypothetical protein
MMAVSVEEFRNEMRALHEEAHSIAKQLADWKVELGERVKALEVHDAETHGNGQPGRLKIVENAVMAMGIRFATIAGGVAILGVVAALLGWIFPRH